MEPRRSTQLERHGARGQGAQKDKFKPPRLPLEIHLSLAGESLNTIRKSNCSVWTMYVQKHEIALNGLVSVAQRKEALGSRVLVRQTSKERLYRKLRLLAQFRRKPYFLQPFEVFVSDSTVDIVCDYVDLTLLHILGNPRLPTENEVAAIAGQGSLLHTYLPLYADASNS